MWVCSFPEGSDCLSQPSFASSSDTTWVCRWMISLRMCSMVDPENNRLFFWVRFLIMFVYGFAMASMGMNFFLIILTGVPIALVFTLVTAWVFRKVERSGRDNA